MRIEELNLKESPERIPPVIFYAEDDDTNRELTAKLMRKVSEVIEDHNEYSIVRTGDGYNGWYLLFDKKTKLSDYMIKYEHRNYKWLVDNGAVTQCILWRRFGSIFTQGITQKVFFDILLPRYGAIMSDIQQTDYGHNFWIDRLAQAISKNLSVGLANVMMHSVEWYEGDYTGIKNWIKQKDAFKADRKYRDLRYIIKQ